MEHPVAAKRVKTKVMVHFGLLFRARGMRLNFSRHLPPFFRALNGH
jgi:hypothetical protein